MSDQLIETQIQNTKYLLKRRMLKHDDELAEMALDLIDYYVARIADLEAQLNALRNPPYRIVTDYDKYEYPLMYQCVVMRGDTEIMKFERCDDLYIAEAEAQDFIDKLTAPFAPKA